MMRPNKYLFIYSSLLTCQQDDDMWMSDGNCLIFFAEETNEEDPRPMCRIHTKTLEQARSVFMINLLRYGEIVVDEDDITPTLTSPTTPKNTWPLMDGPLSNMDEVLNDESTLGSTFAPLSSRVTSTGTWSSGQTINVPSMQNRRVNSDLSDTKSTFPDPDSIDRAASITHEIWFRAPSHITRPEIQRRHHIATRNYIALLYGLPIIGSDFHEMLSDLQNVMDTYYELNDPSERWDSAQVLITYLKARKLDDVRGDLSACLGLMAWSEQSSVRWEAGYMEGFVHAVGMMTSKTIEMREFKLLSQVSRHKLQNAYNALQLRLIEAEERLANFEFPELWYAEGVAINQPAQRAYDEFRAFLNCFYATVWTNWPPKDKDHQKHWLSRTVVNRLQADLGALYDYIVDRDISWDASEERHTRKWEMVSNSAFRHSSFQPDIPGLPITNMLVGFDSSLRYDHIPHPFPLLPTSGTSIKGKPAKKSLFGRFGSKKEAPVAIAGPKEQYQMALAFNAATNVDILGTAFKENKLLDTFQHHEKSFPPSILPPADARLGRWILLYAILQVLSTLSVDVEGLQYSEKIRYFACPSLDGLPPWRSPTHPHHHPNAAPSASASATAPMRDATQAMSYCWTAPARWQPVESTSLASPSLREQRPPSSTPPAYEPLPSNGAHKSPSANLPIRSNSTKNSMADIDEQPPPLPRPAIGPRLFPTIAPIGGLADQRHAFAGGYGSKVGSPLSRDRSGNAFSAGGVRRGVI
jgi:hypothetical protein